MKQTMSKDTMSDAEILEKAIEKAIANGWDFYGFANWQWSVSPSEFPYQTWVYVSDGRPGVYPGKFSVNDILFSQSFAKALWGEKVVTLIFGEVLPKQVGEGWLVLDVKIKQPAWRAHLQKMVLEENPLRYLEQFL